MHIAYVARHSHDDNDDEGSIFRALTAAGHKVDCYPESLDDELTRLSVDCILCHKWGHGENNLPTYQRFWQRLQSPLVLWLFDEVIGDHPSVEKRTKSRSAWMNAILPCLHTGFVTDGLYAARDNSGTLRVLRQGYEHKPEYTYPPVSSGKVQLAFAGAFPNNHARRKEFLTRVARRYRQRFAIYGSGSPFTPAGKQHRIHNQELINLFASVPIWLAPPSPGNDHYWSNRVYLATGMGAFLIHPAFGDLKKEFVPDKELVMYSSESELYQKIEYYLAHPEEREKIRLAGQAKTHAQYSYAARCQKLIEQLQKLLPKPVTSV